MSCCIKCRKTELVGQQADITAMVKGEAVLVTQFSVLACEECGYKTVRGVDMPEYMRAAADSYRQKHSLLTSDEIRARRESLGHTQEEFARYLGVGIASVKRWEMGQVQDRAMDRLIRISTDLKDAHQNYKKLEGLLAPKQFWIPIEPRIWNDDDNDDASRILWQKLKLPVALARKQNMESCS